MSRQEIDLTAASKAVRAAMAEFGIAPDVAYGVRVEVMSFRDEALDCGVYVAGVPPYGWFSAPTFAVALRRLRQALAENAEPGNATVATIDAQDHEEPQP